MKSGKKQYLLDLIAQGEHEHQDFKYQISDARKIARSISAFANNSGGRLLVGVKDNGVIAGVSSDEEIYMIEQAAQMYCKPEQQVQFELIGYEGKTVVIAQIDESISKPVKAKDDNNRWKAYYRVADENVLASSLHVKAMEQENEESASGAFVPGEHEHVLLDYLNSHGGITISGFIKLAHVSQVMAQSIVLRLYDMKVVGIEYHNGECLISLREPS